MFDGLVFKCSGGSKINGLYEIVLLIFALTCSLLIPAIIGGGVYLTVIGAICILSIMSVLLGRSLFLLLNIPRLNGFTTVFQVVVGFSTLSLVNLFFVVFSGFSVDLIVYLDCALVAIFIFFTPRYLSSLYGGVSLFEWRKILLDVLVLIVLSILITFWIREALLAYRGIESKQIFMAWIDFFLHSNEITYLRDFPSFSGQNPYYVGVEHVLYHFGGYSLSAIFSFLSGMNSLESAMYFMLPAGLILFLFAVYGLGCVLGGRQVGVLAVLLILLLPDASMYGLLNKFLGFHWLMQITPTAGYAMALVLVALALFIHGVDEGNKSLLYIAIVICLLSAFFRVHIALLSIIFFAFLLLINCSPKKMYQKIVVYVVIFLVSILIFIQLENIPLAPHVFSGESKADLFFQVMHGQALSAYDGKYAEWVSGSSYAWKIGLGYFLYLIAFLGWILPVSILNGFCSRNSTSRVLWYIPIVLLFSYFSLIAFLPATDGVDMTEYSHRPFVLVYAILMVLLAPNFYRLIVLSKDYFSNRKIYFSLLLLTILFGLIIPLQFGRGIQQGNPTWGRQIAAMPVDMNLLAATQYIKAQSKLGQSVLSSDLDPIGLVVSLTERQAVMARWGLHGYSKNAKAKEKVNQCHSFHDQLLSMHEYEELEHFSDQCKVDWYLLQLSDRPLWGENILLKAVFKSGNYYVFKFN